MMKNEEVDLDDGSQDDFRGATLQIRGSGVGGPSITEISPSREHDRINDQASLLNGTVSNECKTVTESPSKGGLFSVPSKGTTVVPWSGEDARDYFSHRDGLVESAIRDSTGEVVAASEDGNLLGSWLLTEINYWDHEKERLVFLSTRNLVIIKYDFIGMKILAYRKVPLEKIDTVTVGELCYPRHSLIPRVNGLASGVSHVVKGCLVRPLQQRLWASPSTHNQQQCFTNAFDATHFEPRSRNMNGVRAQWNKGEELPFHKKWNPFVSDIPWSTFASHPLLWHKDTGGNDRNMYDVEDFTFRFIDALDRTGRRTTPCNIQHRPIVFNNYVGLSSLIHNKNALGFFKCRGKFSF